MARRHSPYPALPLSLALAFLLSMLPLPMALQVWRPDWVALILMFWVMHAPASAGLWTGLACGLMLDILLAVPLGLHALTLLVQLYFVQMTQRWTGVFSIRQTTMLVLILLLLGRALQYIVLQMLGEPPVLHGYFLPAVASALLWPTVMLSLQRWTQR